MTVATARAFSVAAFERAYARVVLGNRFVEEPWYYRVYKGRYRRTAEALAGLLPAGPVDLLEVGGGQMALLCKEMYGDRCTVADLSEGYKEAVTGHGVGFFKCDLLRDDLEARGAYDAVVLCEVVEHLPIPPHLVLSRVARWLRPGGLLFVTTPNLYRFRNVVRLMTGKPVFCWFMYPGPGEGIGHPLEYSREHLAWQMERAGFTDVHAELRQLTYAGATASSRLARIAAMPALLRPLWRDSLVAWGRAPKTTMRLVAPVASDEALLAGAGLAGAGKGEEGA